MRHRKKTRHFARKSGPRKALFRGLVDALVEQGRIRTTVEKAKELRRHVEKAITLGMKSDLHHLRLLMARYPNQKTVKTIVKDLAPRFKGRAGGYTRLIRLGARPGDQAEMAYIEFVDHDPKKKVATVEPPKRVIVREAKKKRKTLNQIQAESRRTLRFAKKAK